MDSVNAAPMVNAYVTVLTTAVLRVIPVAQNTTIILIVFSALTIRRVMDTAHATPIQDNAFVMAPTMAVQDAMRAAWITINTQIAFFVPM